jgi:hypothetical protein
VSAIPIILVAGGETLYIDLLERFPRDRCRVSFCETVGQTLDRAENAALVIVDSALPGGAEELCRRLRAGAASAQVPIILRGPRGTRGQMVDHVVFDDDLEGLVEAIPRFVPAAAGEADAALDESGFFDVEKSTGAWRRPDEDESDWPPPPPDIEGQDDLLEATRSYAGYVNSLHEAGQCPDELLPAERRLLAARVGEVVQRMDRVLSFTQQGVNQALKRGQLTVMRDLTAARNALYERLVLLRALDVSKLAADAAPAAPAPKESPRRGARAVSPRETPAATPASPSPAPAAAPAAPAAAALPALDDDPRVAESAITRAARAKEAARGKVPALAPPRPTARHAQRATGFGQNQPDLACRDRRGFGGRHRRGRGAALARSRGAAQQRAPEPPAEHGIRRAATDRRRRAGQTESPRRRRARRQLLHPLARERRRGRHPGRIQAAGGQLPRGRQGRGHRDPHRRDRRRPADDLPASADRLDTELIARRAPQKTR